MAYRNHEITSYNYSFDARSGAPGRMQLWAGPGTRAVAEVAFVEDSATVPAPTLAADLNSSTIWFKRSALPGLIDMLRNERPVYVTINNQPPGYVFVHTGTEPTGEGES
jgi:hypothetical protein